MDCHDSRVASRKWQEHYSHINAPEILSSWKLCPSLQDDNLVNSGQLMSWIQTDRTLLVETKRSVVGEEQIGHIWHARLQIPVKKFPAKPYAMQLNNWRMTRSIRDPSNENCDVFFRDPQAGGDLERRLTSGYQKTCRNPGDGKATCGSDLSVTCRFLPATRSNGTRGSRKRTTRCVQSNTATLRLHSVHAIRVYIDSKNVGSTTG